MRKKLTWGIVLFLFFLLWAFSSYTQKGIMHTLVTDDLESLILFIQSFGKFSAIAFFILVVLEVIVAPIPPLLLYISGGLIFGTFLGGTLSLLGNVIGAIIAFFLARYLGKDWVEKKITKNTKKKFDRFVDKYGGMAIFLLRINPFTSSDIFSYLAGLTKMRLRSLVLGTALGLAPLAYLQTYIGGDLLLKFPWLTIVFIGVGVAYLGIFVFGLFYLLKK